MSAPVKGQLMIEILIGLGVITTALVVSLVAVTHATKLSREARFRLEATKYVEQVIENFRHTRDLDKSGFFVTQSCNDPCGTYGDNNMYTCRMTCDWSVANRVSFTVTMTWDAGNGTTSNVSVPSVLTLYDL